MGKSKSAAFQKSLAAMISAAGTRHGMKVRVNQQDRTAAQAQRFHICHMAVYNMFKHQKPRAIAPDGKTIAWSSLSDANQVWVLIDNPDQEFLKTATGVSPQKELIQGSFVWKAGFEPDEQRSRGAMKDFLENHNVNGMAAPGKNGCGYPCGCGGSASKHITGMACDLTGLRELGAKIASSRQEFISSSDAVDLFLEEFDLWRPMAQLKGKQKEEWHVEPLNGQQVALKAVHARVEDRKKTWDQFRFSLDYIGRMNNL